MTACAFAASGDLESLRVLPAAALVELDAHGSAPVHWAASCGHVHVLAWLIEEARVDAECEGLISSRSKRRRPLHWAARNGRLAAVRYLVESARVDPDPRDKQSVSPFQLAVWQCWLEVSRYLVESAGVDVTQVNVYACGAQHWLGTVPRDRTADLLPMAHWLKASGVDWAAVQRQGHRPLHKAAWGGHLELCRWLRDECGAVDDLPDHGGNYAADVAEMYGHVHIAAWLRSENSGARAISCAALGLPPSTTCHATIRRRYLELARRYHPDRQMALSSAKKLGTVSAAHDATEAAAEEAADEEFDRSPMGDGDAPTAAVGDDAAEASGIHSSFETIRAAYVHLTQEGGRGTQCNPTHILRKMLLAATPNMATPNMVSPAANAAGAVCAGTADACATDAGTAGADYEGVRGRFKAMLAAVCYEYGDQGIPLTNLRKKFGEVWRGEQVPTAEALGLPVRMQLLKVLEHFGETVRIVMPAERGAPPRLIAVVSRDTALGTALGTTLVHARRDAVDQEPAAPKGRSSPTQRCAIQQGRAADKEPAAEGDVATEGDVAMLGAAEGDVAILGAVEGDVATEGTSRAADDGRAAQNERAAEDGEGAGALADEGGDALAEEAGGALAVPNTRVCAARWPEKEIDMLPSALRPQPGQTLDLILRKKVLLLQARRGYRANTDSMLLPYFAHRRLQARGSAPNTAPRAVADLGAGNGLVGLLAALQWPCAHVTLFERQPSLAALARCNVALNGLAPPPSEDAVVGAGNDLMPPPSEGAKRTAECGRAGVGALCRASVRHCDLADARTYQHGAFDAVLCNPPYYAPGTEPGAVLGVRRKASSEKQGAWVESSLDVCGFVRVLADLLCEGGDGFLVYDAAERARLQMALQAEATRLRVVASARMVHHAGDAPELSGRRLFVHVRRGGNGLSAAEERTGGAQDGVQDGAHEGAQDGAQDGEQPRDGASSVFALHPHAAVTGAEPAAGRPHGAAAPQLDVRRYTVDIEAWIDRLPACYYQIRTPGFG